MPDIDLNLTRTFLMLYETRSVTHTADLMALTQPTVSHALGRLRKQFNDPLFSRSANGLVPTERADEMYPMLKQAIEAIEATMSGVSEFDPRRSQRTFRIDATDLGEMCLMPSVLGRVGADAHGIGFHVTPFDIATAESRLRQGQADLIICTPRIAAPDLRREPLFRDVYCGIASTRHPRLSTEPTTPEFLAERHIVVEDAAGHTEVDHSLAATDATRQVAMRIEHFGALPQLVAQTEHLSVIPSSVASAFCAIADLRAFPLPFAVAPLEIAVYTYRRRLPDPGITWLRKTVRDAVLPWAVDVGAEPL